MNRQSGQFTRNYRPNRNALYSRPFGEGDIAAQFEGMEIEFNDKATLFPVQVEKNEKPRRWAGGGPRRYEK
jgi:hypothetical protein